MRRVASHGGSGGVDVVVSQFRDAAGTHNVNSICQFASQCTSITYRIDVGISAATALCITEFFD
jgi:hypothetical protein